MQLAKATLVVSGALCAAWLLSAGPAAAQHRHHHHGAAGAGIAAGIAAGALLGAMAAQPAQPAVDPNAVAYCARRFRSYDPQTMTYLGRDGYRHPCP